MLAVGMASMMKMPKWNMFEFKGWFPTMDQARIISTTTFASRMAVADDKNELAEATVRDIATFISSSPSTKLIAIFPPLRMLANSISFVFFSIPLSLIN